MENENKDIERLHKLSEGVLKLHYDTLDLDTPDWSEIYRKFAELEDTINKVRIDLAKQLDNQ